jgi:hypothetical protein
VHAIPTAIMTTKITIIKTKTTNWITTEEKLVILFLGY